MKRTNWILFCLLSLALAACREKLPPAPVLPYPTPIPPTPLPEAMITFQVAIPAPPRPGEAIVLTILDEVTGLALNPQNVIMQADDAQHYTAILPLSIGSVVKYRYTRQGDITVQEHLSDGRAVRYRLYHVEGPGFIQDVVGRWTDTVFEGATGRISGIVTDAERGKPIPNVLITAGGAQSLTTADGTYLLEGLPPGTHNLVAYALDGTYCTFQQGAIVAAESTTPASLQLRAAPMVSIAFTVIVPEDTPADAPIRFAGNLLQLGNTFADLAGGVSSVASRMPPLAHLPDGRYAITLSLPAGADVRYKYTLGDGYWSSEHTVDGTFKLRQIIVPEIDSTVDDWVITWESGSSAPITFITKIPSDTPSGEGISIQFYPGYSWTEPIPMWPIGNNQWMFVLTSPLDMLGEIGYRYCREDQCGNADDIRTVGNNSTGRPVGTSLFAETMRDDVEAWFWIPSSNPATVPSVEVKPRGASFMAGVEFQAAYHPTWGALWSKAINDVQKMGANWLIVTPTWTFTREDPPVLELVPGNDGLWPEQASTILQARSQGLNVALFPTPRFPTKTGLWWQTGKRDFSWWVVWFDSYRTFVLHHADLAERAGAQALILGGDWLSPALPGGALDDGTTSNVPADAEMRWRAIIQEARSRFRGTILWALPYPQGVENPPPFLDAVDQIYVLWSAPLADTPGAFDLNLEAGRLLDKNVLPFQARLSKPLILGIAYPSAHGGYTGCVKNPDGNCVNVEMLARPNPDIPAIQSSTQEQVDAYNAILLAVNDRLWISGVVSRDFYPPVPLEDKSQSVHGKAAAGVLWYWFPKMLGR